MGSSSESELHWLKTEARNRAQNPPSHRPASENELHSITTEDVSVLTLLASIPLERRRRIRQKIAQHVYEDSFAAKVIDVLLREGNWDRNQKAIEHATWLLKECGLESEAYELPNEAYKKRQIKK